MTTAAACAWCNRTFAPRTTGGHAQRFCRKTCRRAFDGAGRRFVAAALADGTLTVDALKNKHAETRALLAGAGTTAPVSEAEELLDELLHTLLSLPPNELSWLIYYRLPGELGERLRDRMKPENRPQFPSRRA
jgi:hypothetical protein